MDYAAARRHMVVSQVRTNDVTDLPIQHAFGAVPREAFLPAGLKDQAYVDREIEYAPGRALITPRDFAKLVAALDIEKDDLVLDVACGSGYSSAILAQVADMVVAVENDEKLAAEAQNAWSSIGVVNAASVAAVPAEGAPDQGPFDVIVIAAAIEIAPEALLAQLKDGGRLGAIFRKDGHSKGVVWRRAGEAIGEAEIFDASARIVAPGFTRPKVFAF